jgi:hypothetical protein
LPEDLDRAARLCPIEHERDERFEAQPNTKETA